MSQGPSQSNQEVSKVVPLFSRKQDAVSSSDADAQKAASDNQAKDESITDAMRKNMENAERIRRERIKANQGVLKSYKIKN